MRIDRVKLIAEMARQSITGIELAKKAGVSRSTVTGLRGGKSCSAVTAMKLASALGIPVEELVER